jgi:caffeoyl-CoA O-methyltransferase
MNRLILATLALLLVSLAAPASAQTSAERAAIDPPAPVRSVLDDIRKADTGSLAVSEEDGRFMRLLVASSRTKHALEIGSASGYSAIWIGLGLRTTGGSLVTIEYDPQRAREAKANIHRAGMDDVVTVVAGDAFKEIPKLSGTFDFVFLDAWKRDYQKFFDLVFQRLDPGGLFLAHNVINKQSEMADFLATIQKSPSLFTTIVSPGTEGVSVSWKKRP